MAMLPAPFWSRNELSNRMTDQGPHWGWNCHYRRSATPTSGADGLVRMDVTAGASVRELACASGFTRVAFGWAFETVVAAERRNGQG
jgi:hypothetical protein